MIKILQIIILFLFIVSCQNYENKDNTIKKKDKNLKLKVTSESKIESK